MRPGLLDQLSSQSHEELGLGTDAPDGRRGGRGHETALPCVMLQLQECQAQSLETQPSGLCGWPFALALCSSTRSEHAERWLVPLFILEKEDLPAGLWNVKAPHQEQNAEHEGSCGGSHLCPFAIALAGLEWRPSSRLC
ncbi:unnamed protein product [Durusdinium trenchii]|uniref:Uncharacterized protein n=1 Tax=Durusdinium trenchii TaxID=1381693 RepID=A0ABP0S656_9DINO